MKTKTKPKSIKSNKGSNISMTIQHFFFIISHVSLFKCFLLFNLILVFQSFFTFFFLSLIQCENEQGEKGEKKGDRKIMKLIPVNRQSQHDANDEAFPIIFM